MKKVKVVMGANWGNEGKGMRTASLCRVSPNPLVIRNNGRMPGNTYGCKR